MNNTFNSSPPQNPSASAIEAALGLLAIAADPAGAKERLDALIAQTADCRAAHAELEAERQRNQKALEAVADLRQREEAVAKAEGEQQIASTRLAVASSAHSEREAQLAKRQADLDIRARDLDAREVALAERLKGFREALA
jgi:hypothetical protein